MKKQRYCHICGKPINGTRSHWMLHPETMDIPGKYGHVLPKTKYDFLCFNFPKLKDKEDLKQKYLNEEWSLPMLCEYVGNLDLKAMQFILTFYEIKIRTIKEARRSGSASQIKLEKTNQLKYGASNPLAKGTVPWKQRNKTVYDKYGVDNVWQCLEQFVDVHTLGNKISKLNSYIEDILIKNNIPYKQEFCISYINEADQKKHKKFYDFFIVGTNILIEANGEYWHADPRKYKADDILSMRNSSIQAKLIWETDEFKKYIAEQNGYQVITFWEKEITNIISRDIIEKDILKLYSNYKDIFS